MSGKNFHSPSRWAGRLAFPAAALAVVLAMRAFQAAGDDAWPWWLAATGATLAALVCLRLRGR